MEHDNISKPPEQPFADRVIEVVQEYLAQDGFTHRMIIDTPKETNAVVPRKYVNLNGTTANRPVGVPGQYYFDNTIGRPVYFNPNSSVWTDGAGSVS